MKSVWKLFISDIKNMTVSKYIIVMMAGLIILPSLYAWFNIKASWDPYGNTQNLKVAVCNDDKGTMFLNTKLNIGEEVVKVLGANKDIGWTFVDSNEEVIDGVTSGKYYAGIIIPEEYSDDFASITTSKITRPEIEYYVNQKLNAISPKITEKGATTLQEQVNQTFIKLTSEIFISQINNINNSLNLNDKLSDQDKLSESLDLMITTINSFKNGTLSLDSVIKSIQSSIPYLSSLMGNLTNGAESGKDVIYNLQQAHSKIISLIENSLNQLPDKINRIERDIDLIFDIAHQDAEAAINLINQLISTIDRLILDNETIINAINDLGDLFPAVKPYLDVLVQYMDSINNVLQNLRGSLERCIDELHRTGELSKELRDEIKAHVNNLLNNANEALSYYQNNIAVPLSNAMNDLYGSLNSSIGILKSGSAALPSVSDSLSNASDAASYAAKGLDDLQNLLINLKDKLVNFEEMYSNLTHTEIYTRLVNLLNNSTEQVSDFISAPVQLNTNTIYPVENYGSAMTPFFTVLSIWVGVILMVSLVSTNVRKENITNDLKPSQAYFSRLLLFIAVNIAQTLIITLGDIFLLGIYCVHKITFIIMAQLISIVFTFIIFSLVYTFGNTGKAIAIIFLVLQIAGSGGTYPVELTPTFFRIINPLLPFTYANGILRECIGGIYASTMLANIFKLILFIPISLFIVFAFRSHLEKFKNKVEEGIEKL